MSESKMYEEMLTKAGIDTEKLCVLHAGGDVIIGELLPDTGLDPYGKGQTPTQIVGRPVTVKNPRRFLTLRQATPRGLSVNSMIGPVETIEGGSLQVQAQMGFKMCEATDETKELILGLYCDFLGVLAKNRAEEAGIVLPGGDLPTGPIRAQMR